MRSILGLEIDYYVGKRKFRSEKAAQKYADKVGLLVQGVPRASKSELFRIQ